MLKRVPFLALLLLAAGCAQDDVPFRQPPHAATVASVDPVSAGSLGLPTAAAVRQLGGGHGFASLRDRGDLVGYPATPVVRHDGAYTWHRAELSEAHALRALVTGVLHITTPSGERLSFRYDRHEEHASGDWTWIGHLEGGTVADDAIITFGAKAAFGSIFQPGKAPLRLTIQDGVSWLVDTDLSRVAQLHNAATDPTTPDFLLPPKRVDGRRAATAPVAAAAARSMAAIGSVTGPVVDLVIGYTSGFASRLGGQSQALTRLNNLVAFTNEAYVNSQIPGQVRLVKALQVNYADNTDNGDALERLTGYRSGSGTTTPDPAFSALRAARDQYGADLVSLVRNFNEPENDSCGIAWLNGGGRVGINQRDEYFGFSVVSDGRDAGTDGNTYFCRDETLAHELGHNMGAAHDLDTSDGDDNVLQSDEYGAYTYSFGYKTDTAHGNFYTVMAYGDSGQYNNRVFSNPRLSICGPSDNSHQPRGSLPCGTSSADNAQTLGQTMPVIATFRATVVSTAQPAADDFDGDGISDVLWRNAQRGANVIWRSANSATPLSVATVGNLAWQVAGIGDFDADGRSDILWRNVDSGANVIWRSGDSTTPVAVATVASRDWRIEGVGDFDGDGRSDILWRNAATGVDAIWRSANSATPQTVSAVTDLRWSVVGVGDFNGDGRDDVLWRHAATGQNAIWLGANSQTPKAIAGVSNFSWAVAGVGDVNGDGDADIVWRNRSSGGNAVWLSADVNAPQTVTTVADQNWTIVRVADYNGDGRDDLLWRNIASGSNVVWRSASSTSAQAVATVADPTWQVVPR